MEHCILWKILGILFFKCNEKLLESFRQRNDRKSFMVEKVHCLLSREKNILYAGRKLRRPIG